VGQYLPEQVLILGKLKVDLIVEINIPEKKEK